MIRAALAVMRASPLVLFAAGLLLPLGWVAVHGWTLTGLYEESIGYRYFYSLRVVYGDEYAFLPQGHLVDIVYQWLQRLLTACGYPPTEVFPRIDVFAYAAVATGHLVAVACFAWAVRPVATLAGRLLSVPFWLAAYYGMGGSGIYVLLQPDYHPWMLSVGLLTAGIVSRWAELSPRWNITPSVALGVLGGVAAAVKATLVIVPGTVALACILTGKSWRRFPVLTGLSVAIGLLTWLAIIFVDSQGRPHRLTRLLRDLLIFAGSSRPAASYTDWLWMVATEAPLLVKLAAALPLLLVGCAFLARSRSELAVVAGLAMGAIGYHVFLYWRFVPATWFEAAVFLQVAVWSVMSVLGRERWPTRVTALGALALVLALALPGGQALADYLRRLESFHQAGQELFTLLSAQPSHVALLIPENSLRPYTIDSAIAKGLSNILDDRLSPLVRRMLPERKYLLGAPRYLPAYYRQHPVDVSDYSTVVFVVPLAGGRTKTDQIQWLETYYSVSLTDFNCGRDVHFSPGAQSVTVCLRPQRVLEERQAAAVLHVPAGARVMAGEPIRDAAGRPARLRGGDVVLKGPSGQLMQIEPGGGAVGLVANHHRQIRVINIGPWDRGRGTYLGLSAQYAAGRWRVDSALVRPANTNSRFEEGDSQSPIPGFWISPEGAGYAISRLRDEHGAFVRVRATRQGPYLVINGGQPLSTLDGVPVTVRGQIRAHSRGKMALMLHDVIAHERADSTSTQSEASEAWQTLLVERDQVIYPAPGDNFSIGLIAPKAGDWFDVRELSLFVGTLPCIEVGGCP